MTQQKVKKYYNKSADYEWKRLFQDPFHKLEYDTTMHFLRKYLPKKGLILDAGGGPGRYSITFARMGYDVVLFDLTPKLLGIAKEQVKKNKVENRVKDIIEGSITDLSMFKDNTFDAVVCLGGPVSHVKTKKQREKAVAELRRVAKKNAPIAISVIGRLAVLIEAPRYWPQEITMTKHFKELWKDGDDNIWCGDAFAHLFLPEELKALVEKSGIKIKECIGLEGIGSHTKKEINLIAKDKKKWKNWLEAHYALCTHPSIFGTSGHMMIIGNKL